MPIIKHTIISRESGFTLVELMMVVFIVGVMAGLVVMTIGGGDRRVLKKEANRIQQLMVIAQDEATLSGQEIGFYLDDRQKVYGFLYFDDQQMAWQPMEKEAFIQRSVPEEYQWSLSIQGERIDLTKIFKDSLGKKKLDNWLTEDNDQKDDQHTSSSKRGERDNKKKADKVTVAPSLIFFSDGHYTPFQLQLSSKVIKDSSYAIEGDGLSSVILSGGELSKSKAQRKKSHDRG